MKIYIQISDCHLRQNKSDLFYQANPYKNLVKILTEINTNQNKYNGILFTGDIVQDIDWASYQNFLDAIALFNWNIPFYLIPGNHDLPQYIDKVKSLSPFVATKIIQDGDWNVFLFNSYLSDGGGAGLICSNQINQITNRSNPIKGFNLAVLHHHVQPFNSFIDNYPLKNADDFLTSLEQLGQVKGILHGHVHDFRQGQINGINWFSSPASSVTFDHETDSAPSLKFGYNQISLSPQGECIVAPRWLA